MNDLGRAIAPRGRSSSRRLVEEATFKVICVNLRQARAQRAPHLRASASKSLLLFRPNADHGDISLEGGKPGRATE
jgi:hypothetical protein